MTNNKRIRNVELSLTPRQIVLLWLATVVKGTFADGGLAARPPRERIANSVMTTVQRAMQGESEVTIERAVYQARVQADALYMLLVDLHIRVGESLDQRDREFTLLGAYMNAVARGGLAKPSMEELRSAILIFAREIIALDVAISQI